MAEVAARPAADHQAQRPRRRRVGRVVAFAGLWALLMVPDVLHYLLVPTTYLRLPLEVVALGVLALVLPARARPWGAGILGFLVGLSIVVRILDYGFLAILVRPFDPVSDLSYLGSFAGVVHDSVGLAGTVLFVIAVVALAAFLLVGMPWAFAQVAELVARNRRAATPVVAGLVALWVGCSVTGFAVASGFPVAVHDPTDTAVMHVEQARDGVAAREEIAQAATADPYAAVPPSRLLTALRGKDVLVVFVESYGRVALEDPEVSPAVVAQVDQMGARLSAAGWSSRSGFVTSPTFAGGSWLAHSTLQSGLWIDDQVRYNALMQGSRLTLSDVFKKVGYRTVVVDPANKRDWPEASSFYHYDQLYDARNLGYAGPSFGYAPVPDQFTLAQLASRELTAGRSQPLFAQVDLISSHTPWTPLPRMVPAAQLGDGSVFAGMADGQTPATEVFTDPHLVRQAYAQSIVYSLEALSAFLAGVPDDNLVVLMLGDHQPATVVSGEGDNRDAPMSVLAKDPAVLARIAGWGLQPGVHPSATAPVLRMDTLRDRLLSAYGPTPAGTSR